MKIVFVKVKTVFQSPYQNINGSLALLKVLQEELVAQLHQTTLISREGFRRFCFLMLGPSAVSREKPDVFCFVTGMTNVFVALCYAGCFSSLVRAQSKVLYFTCHVRPSKWRLPAWFLQRLPFSKIFVASESIQSAFTKLGLQTEVLRQGIKVETERPSGDKVVVPAGLVKLLFAGQFVRRKGVEILLAAIEKLSPEVRHRCHFTFAGEGPLKRAFKQGIEALGNEPQVHWKGFVPRISDLLANKDVTIVPYVYELQTTGVSQFVLESLSCGVPVIGSNIETIFPIVRHEENGLLFEAGDVAGMAAAISRFVLEPRLRESLKAKSKGSVAAYDISAVAREFIEKATART